MDHQAGAGTARPSAVRERRVSACQPGTPAPTDVPENAGPLPLGREPPLSSLVTDRSAKPRYTSFVETDARTALSRAVADYVSQVRVDGPAGRLVRFKRVVAEWADPQEREVLPYACADAQGDQEYDANGVTPATHLPVLANFPDDTHIIHTSNLIVMLRVGVWATDKEERAAIGRALESAFWPVRFTGGFRLDMPHYFGARATFQCMKAAYLDSEADVLAGYRKATWTLKAEGPVIRLEKIPLMTTRAIVAVAARGA